MHNAGPDAADDSPPTRSARRPAAGAAARATPRKTSKRVTITQVAERAGVSIAAVSFAVNGGPGVSDEVRARILDIAREMNFRPSKTARDLRAGTPSTIGLLLADIANPFYSELAYGAIAAAGVRGYEVFVSHVGVDGTHQSDAALAQVDRHSGGLLFTSLTSADTTLLDELRDRREPFVQLYRHVEGIDADFVGIDDLGAGRELGRHVADCGYRRVAVLGGPPLSSASRNRANGFVSALTDAGVDIVNRTAMWGALTRESGAARARELFAHHADVDAVMCGNDVIAVGVYDVCREQGRTVPGDIGLTGFDDMSFSSAGPLQLTTITVPREEMGRRGTELLLDRIDGSTAPTQHVILPHVLRIRETTAPR
ncbi:LacI family DNA-binding transcriptional regulator [Rhodococcus sp. BP-349]|nr:LacI family DNA-binding transcriptional regulator [Rhodococcus sp. BP-363]MBY6542176.1 LacI family DNA-binding transcriptional regulator [Rhodococcus sp. BP-369]MBY6561407.1 LacI family DNA-binding transcriptional regulator [Rhodococcus sp. BP-370]MBY6575698.1 LacI family DNA-binding transcriptional regulator [Rhodococcus sp. BP-364]MBY6584999.1 LacI family DNA-binding transcriptional regulator [Rhodococcus sp. BP-358]MBY6589336.1 LacI family DNA-binding transcriptional regulator [Rhodococc